MSIETIGIGIFSVVASIIILLPSILKVLLLYWCIHYLWKHRLKKSKKKKEEEKQTCEN